MHRHDDYGLGLVASGLFPAAVFAWLFAPAAARRRCVGRPAGGGRPFCAKLATTRFAAFVKLDAS